MGVVAHATKRIVAGDPQALALTGAAVRGPLEHDAPGDGQVEQVDVGVDASDALRMPFPRTMRASWLSDATRSSTGEPGHGLIDMGR